MNNVKIDGTKIMLDKERNVIFNLNALDNLEEKYGSLEKVFEKLSPSDGTMPKSKDIRYVCYVALKEDDETLTEKDVGKLITMQNLQDVIQVVVLGLSGSLPESEGEEKNE